MDEAHAALRDDERLGPIVAEHGPVTITPAEDPFERLVVSVINQQLSVQSAAAIRDRLFEQFAVTPEAMLTADDDALRDVGLSNQKVGYVRNLARAFEDGTLSPETLHEMSDDEIVETLTDIKGVGAWTAKMALIFVFAREDVFPVEDLGIRKGMEALYDFDVDDRDGMVAYADRWRPYRSYASRYLWRAVD